MNNPYLKSFLNLKSAPDILSVVGNLNKSEKEITESMSIIAKLRDKTIKNPMKFTVFDICAGSGLTGIMTAFVLPVKEVIGIDIKEKILRKEFSSVKRFIGKQMDILKENIEGNNETIIVSSHPCGFLAERIIDIFNNGKFVGLIMIPCCIGTISHGYIYSLIKQKISRYDKWCIHLANGIKALNVDIQQDKKCISPCNNVITAWRI